MTTEEKRVQAAAMRWYQAYRDTLRIKLETHPHVDPSVSAWDLFTLLAEEINDLDIRREFARLYANGGQD